MKTGCMGKDVDVEIPDILKEELQNEGGFEHLRSTILRDDFQATADLLKSLADDKRILVLQALSRQRMCVCMLVGLTRCPYSKCSYHLAKLKEAGLITAEQVGNYLVYSLTPRGRTVMKFMQRLMEVLP
jgi:ArsR family transcriptional regulator